MRRLVTMCAVVALVGVLPAAASPAVGSGSHEWVEQANLPIPNQTWDLPVDVSGTRLIVGVPRSDFSDDVGSAYVFRFNGIEWVEEAQLQASDPAVGDTSFGRSVALHGSVAVVGSPSHDSESENAGAVYVFEREAGVWSERAKLLASDASAGDFFGRSADLSAERLVVGAHGRGAAYVFEDHRGRWRERAVLRPTGEYWVGFDVATSGDTVVLGGPDLYVFERSRRQWSQAAVFAAPDADHDFFNAVAISDGTIVAGSSGSSVGEVPGAAYVYTSSSGTWTLLTTLVSPYGVGLDFFGEGVAIDGDTIAVSAPCDFCPAYVYVFSTDDGVWTFEARLSSFSWESLVLQGDLLVVGRWEGGVDIFRRERTS